MKIERMVTPMARQPLWNHVEAAILLDALLKVLQGTIKRKDAVEKVSRTLRQRAIVQGLTIDDKFRNTNGIELQMRTMEYLFTDGKSGLKKSSALFLEIIDMYKNEHDTFVRILQHGIDSK